MDFKEIRYIMWLKSSTGEHGQIKWKPPESFFHDHPYVDYTGNTESKPSYYTQVGSRLYFNCPANETITIRIWYQGKHGNFDSDSDSLRFEPDNIGFQAIVATTLAELHEALPAMEISPKAALAMQKKEYWINKLIEIDIMRSNEEIQMQENVDRDTSEGQTQPYSWV